MNITLAVTRQLALRFSRSVPTNRCSAAGVVGRPRLLVVGVYMAREPNHVNHLVNEFAMAKKVGVEQRWVCMNGRPPNDNVAKVTVKMLDENQPKWQIVNDVITVQDLDQFDYLMISDDDVLLGSNFVDCFIAEQQSLDFALAQPALTWRSFTDHEIVRRRLFTRARQTNFVEVGPVVSFRQDFMKVVFPFSLESPMGWGYDLTWPMIARDLGLTVGIIDGVPIDHSLRARGRLYDRRKQIVIMEAFLSNRPYVPQAEFRTLHTYR